MVMKRKISNLVKKGYTQAAFSRKDNARHFAKLWGKKGYTISALHSSGPTVEGRYRSKSYYVIASRKRRRR